MYACYETWKHKREMQKSGRQHWAQRRVTCQMTLSKDITSALWLEMLNRPWTSLSELWCCQKSPKSLDRQVLVPCLQKRLGVFLLHSHFRSPLLFAAAVCPHSSHDATTSNVPVEGNTHTWEVNATGPWLATGVLTKLRNAWTRAAKAKQKRTKPLQKPDGSVGTCSKVRASYCSYFAQWALIVGPRIQESVLDLLFCHLN